MDEIIKTLKQHQFKNTKLRYAVLSKLIGSASGLSHQELSKSLTIPFDRVTLFRTLSTFERAGVLHKIMDLNGTAKYAFTSPKEQEEEGQHAHFICLNCDKIYCLEESYPIKNIAVPMGFKKMYLEIKIKGICKGCQNKATKNNKSKN